MIKKNKKLQLILFNYTRHMQLKIYIMPIFSTKFKD